MEGTYPIYQADQTIGQAQITRRGLYYHFFCRLRPAEKTLCRLEVTCGNRTESLGVPVPEGNAFVLNKAIPASHLKEGIPTIRVTQRCDRKEIFVPINPEEPFPYLPSVLDARLEYRDGQPGLILKE